MTAGGEAKLRDGILVVAIDHAPVNAIATPVRRLVYASLHAGEHDPRVRAVVITGNERLFSAGADLGEFAAGTAMDSPSLHGDICPLIASMTKPVVAAVGGVAVGGGLELALACHDRVFVANTRVGLPETTLGLMPGAGGTQLLPRAIGVEAAADLIASGRVVPIESLDHPSLVHAIVPADSLVATATQRAASLVGLQPAFRAIADRPVDDPQGFRVLKDTLARLAERPDTLPGVLRALDAIALTASTSIADGMRAEFDLFEPLLASVASRALRHVFLAERRRKPDPEVARFEQTFAARVAARLERERDTLVREGVDPSIIAASIARWRSSDSAPAAGAPGDDPRIAARLLGAIVDEGRAALAAGEAASDGDLDLALVRAGLFARVRGGPFFETRERGVDGRPTRAE